MVGKKRLQWRVSSGRLPLSTNCVRGSVSELRKGGASRPLRKVPRRRDVCWALNQGWVSVTCPLPIHTALQVGFILRNSHCCLSAIHSSHNYALKSSVPSCQASSYKLRLPESSHNKDKPRPLHHRAEAPCRVIHVNVYERNSHVFSPVY